MLMSKKTTGLLRLRAAEWAGGMLGGAWVVILVCDVGGQQHQATQLLMALAIGYGFQLALLARMLTICRGTHSHTLLHTHTVGTVSNLCV